MFPTCGIEFEFSERSMGSVIFQQPWVNSVQGQNQHLFFTEGICHIGSRNQAARQRDGKFLFFSAVVPGFCLSVSWAGRLVGCWFGNWFNIARLTADS